MKKTLTLVMLLLPMTALPFKLSAQSSEYERLLAEIERIKAIDNHTHVTRVVAAGEEDHEYDALPFELLEPFPLMVRLRPDNLEYAAAWTALYGYKYSDMSDAHVRELADAKHKVMRDRGDSYPTWVLDQLGIDIMLANRVAMGRGLNAPRFRWVSYIDALVFPLSNEAAKRMNLDYRAFYPAEERLLKRYLSDLKLTGLPASLKEYSSQVITPTLERQKKEGAVAVKFEIAYLRSLGFSDPPESEASRVYARWCKGGEPPVSDYAMLQDYLFRQVCREAGRLGLAVHIHVFDGGGGSYVQSGSNPTVLDSVFNDPSLRKTNFVIVHGGYPHTKSTAGLLSKPNVWADFSAQDLLIYPRALSEVLRNWMEYYPEKILFGTDASPSFGEIGWEETGWLATQTARQALAMALTAMIQDREITHDKAVELARLALRDNAMKLYGFESAKGQ
ncbi:MAG TPA: amidohydrolase family protein [Blastocatellia bacterium]|nr:amidohydrolase family protein [Blastocatellia bacterium]